MFELNPSIVKIKLTHPKKNPIKKKRLSKKKAY